MASLFPLERSGERLCRRMAAYHWREMQRSRAFRYRHLRAGLYWSLRVLFE